MAGNLDTGDAEGPLRRLRKAETVLQMRVGGLVAVLEAVYDVHNVHAVLRTCDCLGIQNVWVVEPVTVKIDKHAKKGKVKHGKKDKHPFFPPPTGDPASPAPPSNPGPTRTGADDPGTSAIDTVAAATGNAANADAGLEGGNAKECVLPPNWGYGDALFKHPAAQWLTIRRFRTTKACIAAARAEGRELWVTNLSQHSEALDPEWRAERPNGGAAVVFGRETDGVSPEMAAAADRSIYYPLSGFTESFNISVAAAVVLSTVLRQCPGLREPLLPNTKAALRAIWYGRLAKTPAQKEAFAAAVLAPPEPWTDLRWPEQLRQQANNVPKKIREAENAEAVKKGLPARAWRTDQHKASVTAAANAGATPAAGAGAIPSEAPEPPTQRDPE